MNAITQIVAEFEDDLRNYMQVPWPLIREYAELRSTDRARFSIFASLVILNYCIMKLVDEMNIYDDAMVTVMKQAPLLCAIRCPDGREINDGLGQYVVEYFEDTRRRGCCWLISPNLKVPDEGAFFESMVAPAYPYFECFTKSFIKNKSSNLADFMMYFIKKAEERYAVYKPPILQYHSDCSV